MGDSFPDYTLLPQLAQILQVEIQEILNGEYLEKPNKVEETKEVVYIERQSNSEQNSFKGKLINALLFVKQHQHYFFLSFYLISFLLLFFPIIKWNIPMYSFSNNFFKFLFVPFKKDINEYLYSSALCSMFTIVELMGVSIKQLTTMAWITSVISWIYVITFVVIIIKLVMIIVNRESYDNAFKQSVTVSVLCILSFIIAKVFISTIDKIFENANMSDMTNVPIKTSLLWSVIWSFIAVTFSALFKYLKCFNNDIEDDSQTVFKDEEDVESSNEYFDKSENKKQFNFKKIISFVLVIGIIVGGCFGVFTIFKKVKSSPENTWNSFIDCINKSKYE